MNKKTYFTLALLSAAIIYLFSILKAHLYSGITPATGDDSHTVLWLVVFALSLVLLIFTIRSLYKNRPVK